ncbi:MAG: ABC transporter permease, partial [Chromatiales bacterium]|nr:ABC transporter permease [Chromatiales bacterium]
PPQLVVYEQYREQQATGRYDWVLRAPVPYSPKDYLRDYGDTGLESPLRTDERRHWLGTEENGADVLSRMIHASRIALGIGFIATGIALVIGVIVGGLMGYFSGIVDMIGMRVVEIFEAIPTLFLLLTFVAFFGRSLYMMMIIIGITGWSGYARYVRAEFLKLRGQDYVQAAVACGLPLRSILFRHMLPNGVAPILVAASFGVASAILAEATLSFLGLGLIDDPSWGQMLNQAVQSSAFNWWMAAFPGGAIFLTVFAYNLIGESMRDAIDPYLGKTPT